MLRRLQRVVPAGAGRPSLPEEHGPIRTITRHVAFDPSAWTPERAGKVAALFDSLAPDWDGGPAVRREAVADALDRGGPFPAGPCLEVGAGTGMATPLLAARFSPMVCVDLSAQMLAVAAENPAPRVQADAAALPVRTGTAAVVALVNMFLFPAEVDRALAPGGVVLWVNTLGDDTPIHLPAEDVVAALPGGWDGVTADAGWGTWTSLRRAAAS
ncbi:MAG: class I SAM-dependent DNA methyltransferase [Acidimicrobiales bacterium]